MPFIFLISCTPVNTQNNLDKKIDTNEYSLEEKTKSVLNKEYYESSEETNNNSKITKRPDVIVQKKIVALFTKGDKEKISKQFVNVLEYAINDKKLKEIKIDVEYFENPVDLKKYLSKANNEGKIYIGPFGNENTALAKSFCSDGAIFFSFSSNIKNAGDCIYLVNFFPENELDTLFKFQKKNTKVAFLFPENDYGYYINSIIDNIINKSEAIIINRSSYKQDMSNVRSSIKELGKYELRKYELERQILSLQKLNSEEAKNRLAKLKRFKTVSDYDFTHLLIADYGLRMLEVAPLLQYYDIDPNIVKFMGTGVLDDENFFNEPSLQGAIFPGVEKNKRIDLVKRYEEIYGDKFIRISTIIYDVIGILNYIYEKELSLQEIQSLLKNSKIKFDGVDGSFLFKNNIIQRDLNILEIRNGSAQKLF